MTAYALNLMMYDLREPENRQSAQFDLPGYVGRYDLSDAEKRVVLDSDWQGCIDAGASVYVLTKVGATLDVSLLHMGAQMRGQAYSEFLEFVQEQNQRVARFALVPGSGGGDRG